ncbi:MAG: 3'-5' exonuclease domain-containing protein 2 [Bacteroidaceae bacterium]|nr:3'-5' exonuclease domain-containing protein 2 [Bacteroidaceae bacterium]
MKILKDKFDKSLIHDLPKVSFDGSIYVIISENEAERAVNYLLKQDILGFDTETRPSFQKGKGMNKVALLQVATDHECFLFRLNHIGLPDCVKRLLSDTQVTKIGLSWHDDLNQLRRRSDFSAGTFVELQTFVKEFGIEDMALQKLYANIFGQHISKSQRLTNWEADNLTEAQQRYAATDAWACVKMYIELMRLKCTGDYVIDRVDAEEE